MPNRCIEWGHHAAGSRDCWWVGSCMAASSAPNRLNTRARGPSQAYSRTCKPPSCRKVSPQLVQPSNSRAVGGCRAAETAPAPTPACTQTRDHALPDPARALRPAGLRRRHGEWRCRRLCPLARLAWTHGASARSGMIGAAAGGLTQHGTSPGHRRRQLSDATRPQQPPCHCHCCRATATSAAGRTPAGTRRTALRWPPAAAATSLCR